MLTLFQIWQSFQSLVNTAQNSFFRPQTDFQQSVNDISKELWDKWTRLSEKNQQIRDFLSPFLKSKNCQVTPKNSYYGFVTQPKDYGRFGSARIWSLKDETVPCPDSDTDEGFKTQEQVSQKFYEDIEERQVDLIDETRWASCLTHLTKAPTLAYPKITQIDGGWKVSPRTVSIIVLDYYTIPMEGTFRYSVVAGDSQTGAGDFIQYDALNSTPLQWPETVLNYFLVRLAKRYGMFINNTFLSQFAASQQAA